MNNFTQADLNVLCSDRPGPCVSLYMPLQPQDAQQDPIRWKRLLAEAERRLSFAGTSEPVASKMLRPAVRLLDKAPFWQSGGLGLACFLAPDFIRTYRLGLTLREHVSIGGLFEIRPLLPWMADSGQFYVLAISQNAVRLIHGNRHEAARIELAGSANFSEVLRAHDTEDPLTYHTFAKGAGPMEAAFHGHGVGIDDAKDDLLRYCRAIDQSLHQVLKNERAPLVVATVGYVLPIFRQASKYQNVLEHGIPGNPEHLSDRDLIDRAWPLVEPILKMGSETAIALYRQLSGSGRTTHDIGEVVTAANRGNIQSVFISSGSDVWGRFDPESKRVDIHKSFEQGDEDLTNFAAVHALRHGREVHFLAAEQMPERSPLAAIYPLPMAKHGPRPRRRKAALPADE